MEELVENPARMRQRIGCSPVNLWNNYELAKKRLPPCPPALSYPKTGWERNYKMVTRHGKKANERGSGICWFSMAVCFPLWLPCMAHPLGESCG